MRFAEIIQELNVGKVGANVSTIDRSAPWTKKQSAVAYNRAKTFNQAGSGAEKFDFLYKETNGFTTKKQIGVKIQVKGIPLSIDSYDSATGELIVRNQNPGKIITKYKTNIKDYEFVGREKSVASGTIVYKFQSDVSPTDKEQVEKPGFKSQAGVDRRPRNGKNKTSQAANATLVKANNPFGI